MYVVVPIVNSCFRIDEILHIEAWASRGGVKIKKIASCWSNPTPAKPQP